MLKQTALLATVMFIGTWAVAEQPERKPWEWTQEERLAVRLDPAQIARRQNAEAARAAAATPQPSTTAQQGLHNYSIDGSRNPELLLPHELFRSLLSGFMPNEEARQRKRDSLRAAIVAAGFDEALFWSQLRAAASEYIDNHVYPAPGTPHRPGLCRSAFVSLNNARQVFGKDRFDRFLYEAIAPVTQVTSATNAADPSAELRFVAAGCQ